VLVTLVRGAESRSSSLAALMADPSQNVQLAPGDQIRLIYQPRKFSTFGALAKSAQVPIEDDHLTLANAISRMGGLDPNTANARSILVFRMERPAVARAIGLETAEQAPFAPVIYRFNMREPSGFFVANNFEVRSDDLIYVPRSDAAELRKFFELVSSVSRVAYDVRVTSVLR
jgi:polysaccharide biosynthesis/export protein